MKLKTHLQALRRADEKFFTERDRRYAEVAVEREKALRIKESADLAALQLAREIQTYKDEKANELREQINSERGHYASKEDLAGQLATITALLDPIRTYVASEQGQSKGVGLSFDRLLQIIFAGAAIVAIGVAFLK
jgi:hypothetical protein